MVKNKYATISIFLVTYIDPVWNYEMFQFSSDIHINNVKVGCFTDVNTYGNAIAKITKIVINVPANIPIRLRSLIT